MTLGQYSKGEIRGQPVPGYLEENGVAAGSTTETFAAIKVEIMNWRWQGVPFYLRTGKRMPRQMTRIGVRFRNAPVTTDKLLDLLIQGSYFIKVCGR